jgi:hypothetical protein
VPVKVASHLLSSDFYRFLKKKIMQALALEKRE